MQNHSGQKPHSIGEQLISICAKDIVRLVAGEDSSRKLDNIFVSNDTVSSGVNEVLQKISE